MNNLQISDDYQPVLEHVKSFIKEKIEPMEEEFHSEIGKGGDRWQYTERMTEILVHVKAHVYAARAVLPGMIARGEGYLLNTASAAGLLSQIGSMHYSVTKAAAVGLAEWLQITHANQGIWVSVLCPQEVATDIDKNMYKSKVIWARLILRI